MGQVIFEARRAGAILISTEYAFGNEMLQAPCENVSRQSRGSLKVFEPPNSKEAAAEDQPAPLIADDFECLGDRAIGGMCAFHL